MSTLWIWKKKWTEDHVLCLRIICTIRYCTYCRKCRFLLARISLLTGLVIKCIIIVRLQSSKTVTLLECRTISSMWSIYLCYFLIKLWRWLLEIFLMNFNKPFKVISGWLLTLETQKSKKASIELKLLIEVSEQYVRAKNNLNSVEPIFVTIFHQVHFWIKNHIKRASSHHHHWATNQKHPISFFHNQNRKSNATKLPP